MWKGMKLVKICLTMRLGRCEEWSEAVNGGPHGSIIWAVRSNTCTGDLENKPLLSLSYAPCCWLQGLCEKRQLTCSGYSPFQPGTEQNYLKCWKSPCWQKRMAAALPCNKLLLWVLRRHLWLSYLTLENEGWTKHQVKVPNANVHMSCDCVASL